MGRFRQVADEETETAIDMSPLIDCVFILLIFFIVTTVFVEETGVTVNKPEAQTAASQDLEKTSILIAITEEGDVIYGGEPIGAKGVGPVVSREVMSNPDIPVIIQADRDSVHKVFSEVYQEAQAAGATKISFSTKLQ